VPPPPVVHDARPYPKPLGDLGDAHEFVGSVTPRHPASVRTRCHSHVLRTIVRRCTVVPAAHDPAQQVSAPTWRSAMANQSLDPHTATMERLAEWLMDDQVLLAALVVLRQLGDEAVDAVAEILGLSSVRRLRLAWELWAHLHVESGGRDPFGTLAEAIPEPVLDNALHALWGDAPNAISGHAFLNPRGL
jgi:hypothetical protein